MPPKDDDYIPFGEEWEKSMMKMSKATIVSTNETKVFLYETAPVCKVTGVFTLDYVIFAESAFKYILKSHIERGCVDIDALRKYQGKSPYLHGWAVYKPSKFDSPKTLEDFGLKRPPQSWCYTEVDV